MTLSNLRIFILAYEENSFVRVARMGVPRAFVDRTILTIEEEIGRPLFIRKSDGGVEKTPEARPFYFLVNQALAILDEAIRGEEQ